MAIIRFHIGDKVKSRTKLGANDISEFDLIGVVIARSAFDEYLVEFVQRKFQTTRRTGRLGNFSNMAFDATLTMETRRVISYWIKSRHLLGAR